VQTCCVAYLSDVQLGEILRHIGVSSSPVHADNFAPRPTGAKLAAEPMLDHIVRRLISRGMCCYTAESSCNPASPGLRCKLAAYRASVLQTMMHGRDTDCAAAWTMLLVHAAVVTGSEAAGLATLTANTSSGPRIPFLDGEWAWICGQLNAAMARVPLQVALQYKAQDHGRGQPFGWFVTTVTEMLRARTSRSTEDTMQNCR
jgi:hypothetical protein